MLRYNISMHSLTRDELATMDLQPTDRVVLDREMERHGWVTIVNIRERRLQSVKRYEPSYFRRLCTEGRLPMTQEDQLVIGLN